MKRDPAIVSKTMSAIRGKDTGIEKRLRKALSEQGIHYRLYSTKVIGHPDILIDSLKIAIFCDSEFWHGYRFEENEAKLTSNRDYWVNKIRHNKERDEIVNKTLKEQGYLVLRFWGEQINKHLDEVVNEILEAVNKRKHLFALREGIKEKTTLVYIEKEGSYLMLCRDKEEGDPNSGKWLGVGGHLEPGESPAACLKREVREETGLLVKKYRYCGKVDFLYESVETERMFLYVVDEFEGALHECDEGTLEWIKKEDVPNLNVWDGDRVFLPLLLNEKRIFDLALYYNEKGELLDVVGPFYKKEKKQCKKTKRK